MSVTEGVVEPNVVRAAHVGAEYNGILRELRRAVSVSGVHYVEYYDHGLPTVSVDLLHAPRLAPLFQGSRTVARARRDHETIGRQLNHRMAEMNAVLSGLASGRLIRTIFAAPDCAVLYFDVDEGQYLVGFSFGADAIERADRTLSATATAIRRARAASDPNYGGYSVVVDARAAGGGPGGAGGEGGGAGGGGVAPRPEAIPDTGPHTFTSLPRPAAPVFANPWASLIERRWSPARDDREDDFQAQAATILQPDDLHYVALVRGGTVSSADLLDHSRLDDFFVGPSRNARREGYAKVGAEFLALSDLLDGLLRSVLKRRLTRTVLDVEKGALYFHRLSRDDFLLGVTLDQRRVFEADQRFQLLVRRMAERAAG